MVDKLIPLVWLQEDFCPLYIGTINDWDQSDRMAFTSQTLTNISGGEIILVILKFDVYLGVLMTFQLMSPASVSWLCLPKVIPAVSISRIICRSWDRLDKVEVVGL